MHPRLDLKLVVRIVDSATRNTYVALFRELMEAGELVSTMPNCVFETILVESREQAFEHAADHLAGHPNRVVVFLFDIPAGLVASGRQAEVTEGVQWAIKITPEMKRRCATIAIMRNPWRLNNIDRAIDAAETAQLLDRLKLVVDRLAYTSIPEKKSPEEKISIRLIRRQNELMDYFRLRHRVYKIMGYLTQEIEDAHSQMEINWFDTISLPIGAYAQAPGGREVLVGTARVVVGTAADPSRRPLLLPSYDHRVRSLADTDPVLKAEMYKSSPLQLPVFESFRLHDSYRQTNTVCGELSRVIVDKGYRGSGLSSRLIQFALGEATKVGVSRVFLECLELHEELYKKLGFRRVAGISGTVLRVNQTMIAMELAPALDAQRAAS